MPLCLQSRRGISPSHWRPAESFNIGARPTPRRVACSSCFKISPYSEPQKQVRSLEQQRRNVLFLGSTRAPNRTLLAIHVNAEETFANPEPSTSAKASNNPPTGSLSGNGSPDKVGGAARRKHALMQRSRNTILILGSEPSRERCLRPRPQRWRKELGTAADAAILFVQHTCSSLRCLLLQHLEIAAFLQSFCCESAHRVSRCGQASQPAS